MCWLQVPFDCAACLQWSAAEHNYELFDEASLLPLFYRRFANKYGANVDGYSPIYTPDTWSESGDSYKLGTKGLIAW